MIQRYKDSNYIIIYQTIIIYKLYSINSKPILNILYKILYNMYTQKHSAFTI